MSPASCQKHNSSQSVFQLPTTFFFFPIATSRNIFTMPTNSNLTTKYGACPLLSPTNFSQWRNSLQYLLIGADTWDIVTGIEEQPAMAAPNATVAATARARDDLKDFRKRSQLALSLIFSSVSPALQSYIQGKNDPVDMWTTLVSRMDEVKNEHGATLVRQQFHSEKFKDGEAIETYVARITDYQNRLANTRQALTDDDIISKLLIGLPSKYETDKKILLNDPAKTLTSVINVLHCLKITDTSTTTEHNALASSGKRYKGNYYRGSSYRGRSRDGNRGHGRSYRVNYRNSHHSRNKSHNHENKSTTETVCWYCAKPGHTRQDCFIKQRADELHKKHAKVTNEADIKIEHLSDKEFLTQNARQALIISTSSFMFSKSLALHTHSRSPSSWYIDSGASDHYCSQSSMFSVIHTLSAPKEIFLGDNSSVLATGIGTVRITVYRQTLMLFDVLFVPDLHCNLLSVYRLIASGFTVYFTKDGAHITSAHGHMDIVIPSVGSMYVMSSEPVCDVAGTKIDNTDSAYVAGSKFEATATSLEAPRITSLPVNLWHRRLGHLNHQSVQRLASMGAMGITIDSKEHHLARKSPCIPCLQGKQHMTSNKAPSMRTSQPLELVLYDMCGPMPTLSVSGYKYFIIYVDDFSRYTCIYFLKTKSSTEVCTVFRYYKALVEAQVCMRKIPSLDNQDTTLKLIRRFRCDNGKGEYNNAAFKNILAESGISFEPSTPYTQHQNGVSERMIRTVTEMMRCMLHDSNMEAKFWAEAVNTAVYIRNRCPASTFASASGVLTDMITPFEAWTGTKPDISHLRPFGCKVYAHVPKQKRNKLEAKSKEYRLLGYMASTNKIWRVWDEESQKEIAVTDVVFDEGNSIITHSDSEIKHTVGDSEAHITVAKTLPPVNGDYIDNFLHACMIAAIDDCSIPISFEDALSCDDAGHWRKAISAELQALEKNKTWKHCNLPHGKAAIDCRWVFAKRPTNSLAYKYKARLVVRGYQQTPGVDYTETFAPVARFESIRLLMAMAAMYDWEIIQMDVKSAFLNPTLDEEIYITKPQGYDTVNDNEGNYLRLLKSLYGLKQAPRIWYRDIDTFLITSAGFQHLSDESNIYFKSGELAAKPASKSPPITRDSPIDSSNPTLLGGPNSLLDSRDPSLVILLLYVDDILLYAPSLAALEPVMTVLQDKYEMSSMGNALVFLGLQIERNRHSRQLLIHQNRYIAEMMREFQLESVTPYLTPMETTCKLDTLATETAKILNEEGHTQYRRIIGKLMYAMTGTRPDIAFAVSYLGRFAHAPTTAHLTAAKRVLAYLIHSRNLGIVYSGSPSNAGQGYSDSDWAGDRDERKSTSGYVFMYAGGAISWKSCKQRTVASSSTAAEYIAVDEACKEGIWLSRVATVLGVNFKDIKVDNTGALQLATNNPRHGRMKHIDVRYHHIRECVKEGKVQLSQISTVDNVADILTKPLPKDAFNRHCENMGIGELD